MLRLIIQQSRICRAQTPAAGWPLLLARVQDPPCITSSATNSSAPASDQSLVQIRLAGLPRDWSLPRVQEWISGFAAVQKLAFEVRRTEWKGVVRLSSNGGVVYGSFMPEAVDAVLAKNGTTFEGNTLTVNVYAKGLGKRQPVGAVAAPSAGGAAAVHAQ